jgi:MoxR-like ATPase
MSSVGKVIKEVLNLQKEWEAESSPAMKLRTELVTKAMKSAVMEILSQLNLGDDFSVEGSAGFGGSARIPWVRIFDKKFSPNPQTGFYVVFLFSFDGESVSISLNQGTTIMRGGSTATLPIDLIQSRSDQLRTFLQSDSTLESLFESELKTSPLSLGFQKKPVPGYRAGDVFHYTVNEEIAQIDSDISRKLETLLKFLRFTYDNYPTGESLQPNNESEALGELSKRTGWDVEKLAEMVNSLTDESPQIVLTGPPGTGKTFLARQLASHILDSDASLDSKRVRIVQFHPSYGYEDFVEGLRPVASEGGAFSFKTRAGTIVELADEIAADGEPRVLIIDEMNRANVPRVFGELMYLLEYRGSSMELMNTREFKLPPELYIIGTMNTADRSIRSVDLALRRRFDFFDIPPSVPALRAWYDRPENENKIGEILYQGLEALNADLQELLGRHYVVGHSFLMAKKLDRQFLGRVWAHQIWPLLEEYFFAAPMDAEQFSLEKFWPDV